MLCNFCLVLRSHCMYPSWRRQSQNALRYLSSNRIRAADHSRFCYSWMLYQSVFHLKWTDAVPKTHTQQDLKIWHHGYEKQNSVPCGQNDIISSADEPQVSFIVHHSPVTRQVEITSETLCCALWLSLYDTFRFIYNSSLRTFCQ